LILRIIFNILVVRPRRLVLLVCHCNRICDRTIRENIRIGARTVEDIGRACGAGTGCGGCRATIRELLSNCPIERRAAREATRGELGAPSGAMGMAG
jgi:bacterioferritin-associated ferredoxin